MSEIFVALTFLYKPSRTVCLEVKEESRPHVGFSSICIYRLSGWHNRSVGSQTLINALCPLCSLTGGICVQLDLLCLFIHILNFNDIIGIGPIFCVKTRPLTKKHPGNDPCRHITSLSAVFYVDYEWVNNNQTDSNVSNFPLFASVYSVLVKYLSYFNNVGPFLSNWTKHMGKLGRGWNIPVLLLDFTAIKISLFITKAFLVIKSHYNV